MRSIKKPILKPEMTCSQEGFFFLPLTHLIAGGRRAKPITKEAMTLDRLAFERPMETGLKDVNCLANIPSESNRYIAAVHKFRSVWRPGPISVRLGRNSRFVKYLTASGLYLIHDGQQ